MYEEETMGTIVWKAMPMRTRKEIRNTIFPKNWIPRRRFCWSMKGRVSGLHLQ